MKKNWTLVTVSPEAKGLLDYMNKKLKIGKRALVDYAFYKLFREGVSEKGLENMRELFKQIREKTGGME